MALTRLIPLNIESRLKGFDPFNSLICYVLFTTNILDHLMPQRIG